jgi:rare lipoprotein A
VDRDAGGSSSTGANPLPESKSRYGNPETYVVFGKRYSVLDTSAGFVEEGIASWYGEPFHGRRTSSGETYDMYTLTAAHKHLPLPTYALVTNLDNGRRIVVRVNDRGPFHEDRVIDLSYAAALELDMVGPGTARVNVRALDPAATEREPLQ